MADKSLQEKKATAHKIVAGFAATAGATGAIPIPIAHMFPLIGEQVAMLSAITTTFGFKVRKGVLTTFVHSAIGISFATFAGKMAVGALLDLVPGGQVAGVTISAATAAALTTFIGEVYILLMVKMSERGDGDDYLKSKAAQEEFKKILIQFKKFLTLDKGDNPAPDAAPNTETVDLSEQDDSPMSEAEKETLGKILTLDKGDNPAPDADPSDTETVDLSEQDDSPMSEAEKETLGKILTLSKGDNPEPDAASSDTDSKTDFHTKPPRWTFFED